MDIRAQTRFLVKQVIEDCFPTRHAKNGDLPDIFLFASRRGGSTWLAEIILRQPGIRLVRQPLSFFSSPPFLHNYLPIVNESQFIHLEDPELRRVEDYFTLLSLGKMSLCSNSNIFSRKFWERTNRTLFKILNGKPLINWFERTFRGKIVCLLRHPFSQAASVIRAGWRNTSWAYLASSYYCDTVLSSRQIDYSRRILREGTLEQRAVLNWFLENLVPLQMINNAASSIHFIFYEEMATNPLSGARGLFDFLEIANWESFFGNVRKASGTAAITHSKRSVDFADQQIKWNEFYSKTKGMQLGVMFDLFEIDCYSPHAVDPVHGLVRQY